MEGASPLTYEQVGLAAYLALRVEVTVPSLQGEGGTTFLGWQGLTE